MYSPRFLSGKKSICLFSMLFNISNALDDVTETSQCAFSVADEFIVLAEKYCMEQLQEKN